MKSKIKIDDAQANEMINQMEQLEEHFNDFRGIFPDVPPQDEVTFVKMMTYQLFLENIKMKKRAFSDLIKSVENNNSLLNFIYIYKDIYEPTEMNEMLRDKFASLVLGEDNKKDVINVFIQENPYKVRPVIYTIRRKKDTVLPNDKKVTEEEAMRLIEAREIVITYNTVYEDYEDREHFFCAIDECLNVEDPRVVKFTLDNYPFIYREIRNGLDVKTIEADRKLYAQHMEKIIKDTTEKINDTSKEIKGFNI